MEKYFKTFRKFERQVKTRPLPKPYIKTISSGNTLIMYETKTDFYVQTKTCTNQNFTDDALLKKNYLKIFRKI